ncbi:hypothetical protein JCM8202_003614 [Rhodotorula sphaerocarpa]
MADAPDFQAQLDRVHEHLKQRARDLATLPTIARPDLIELALREAPADLPGAGLGLQETTTHLLETICPALAPGQAGPRFFGLVTGGVTPAAQLADMLVSSYDPCVQEATVSVALEDLTLRYLLSLLSLPRARFTHNTLTTGATASNVLGLCLGRDWTVARIQRTRHSRAGWSVPEDGFGAVEVDVFVSDAHASVKKAAALAGIGRRNVIDLGDRVKEERGYLACFDLERLEACLRRNEHAGRASIVVVSFGEVNTGALASDTPAVRGLCDRYHAHLHLDAAFGAFAILDPSFAHYAPHLALADSITSDAHKWLNVPYDCGLFFSRRIAFEGDAAAGAEPGTASLFELTGPGASAPAYLAGSRKSAEGERVDFPLLEESRALPSPLFMGIENSRRFRALPLYASLLSLGASGYADLVQRNIAFARRAEAYLRAHPAFEVLTPEWPEPVGSAAENESTALVDPRPAADPSDPWRFRPLNIVLFAPSPLAPSTYLPSSGPSGAAKFLAKLNESREGFFTGTVWRGRAAVRMAVSNGMTGTAAGRSQGSDAERDWEAKGASEEKKGQDSGERDWEVVRGIFERVAKG